MGASTTKLDGSLKEQIKSLKEFFGLDPNQSFQELDIDDSGDTEDTE